MRVSNASELCEIFHKLAPCDAQTRRENDDAQMLQNLAAAAQAQSASNSKKALPTSATFTAGALADPILKDETLETRAAHRSQPFGPCCRCGLEKNTGETSPLRFAAAPPYSAPFPPAQPAMPIIISILQVLVVIVSLLIILLVLMQRPKNEGLGATFGGGMTENIFGAQTTNVLQKMTRNLGITFFILTIGLSWLYVKAGYTKSNVSKQLSAEPIPAATPAPAATPLPDATATPVPDAEAAPIPDAKVEPSSAAAPDSTPAGVASDPVKADAPAPAPAKPEESGDAKPETIDNR